MADKAHKNAAVEPANSSTDEEVEAQLRESRRAREEAETIRERADQTASEMAKVLRRIAAAIDRNPQSWDSLFVNGKR